MVRHVSAALLVLALLVSVARADFVIKKDGTVIEGEVTHRDESRVVVTQRDGTVIEIPRSAIDSISRNRPDANARKPEPPAPPPKAEPKAEPRVDPPEPTVTEPTPAEVDSSSKAAPAKPDTAVVGSTARPKAKKEGPPDYEDLLAEYTRIADEAARQAFLKKYDKKTCRLTATLLEAKDGTVTMTITSRDGPDTKLEVPCLRLKVQTSHGAVADGYPVYINKLLGVPRPGEAPRCDLTDINKMKKAPRGSTVFIDGKILMGSQPPMALCDPRYSFTPPK